MEIVKLIGADVLPEDQKLVIEIARVIRVGFLQQNAYHEDGHLCARSKAAEDDGGHPATSTTGRRSSIDRGHSRCPSSPATGIFEQLVKMKYEIPNDQPGAVRRLLTERSTTRAWPTSVQFKPP